MKKILFFLFAVASIFSGIAAQENPQFTIQAYQQFLLENQNLTSKELKFKIFLDVMLIAE